MTRQGTGTHVTPSGIGRVMDDGTSQIWRYEYNARGTRRRRSTLSDERPSTSTGPTTSPTPTRRRGEGMDLLQVKRKNGGSYDVLRSYTYNAKHQPLTITDARGAVTTYTYNTAGQVLTVTTPPAQGHSQGPTTTFTYDTNGYLQQVTGPVPGATTTFTYDGYGRKRTSTDAAGPDAHLRLRRPRPGDEGHLSRHDLRGDDLQVARRREAPRPPRAAGRRPSTTRCAGRWRRGTPRRDHAVPVRRRGLQRLHGRRRPAHEAHRRQRQRDELGLRPPGPGDARDEGGRQPTSSTPTRRPRAGSSRRPTARTSRRRSSTSSTAS